MIFVLFQDRREDTSLQLAHFRKHKRKQLKKTQGKAVVNNVHKPSEHNPAGKDDTNRLTKAIVKAADLAGSAKGKKVHEFFMSVHLKMHYVLFVES